MMFNNLTFTTCCFLIFSASNALSQESAAVKAYRQGDGNYVQSAVPFLTIAPDSRAGAMGDAGVATSADVNSMHWNPAKFAFTEKQAAISVSYSPWLRNLVNDINLAYLTGYYHISKDQVIASSLRYFSLGEIQFTDGNGDPTRTVKPNELAFDAAYSRLLGPNFSMALAFRFVHSDLSLNETVDNVDTKPGQTFAGDIAAYYSKDLKIQEYNSKLAFGINISNIGSKISYTSGSDQDFIPTNLRLGSSLYMDFDPYNSLTVALDFNKLLVPTPPIYLQDITGVTDSIGTDGQKVIQYGKNPNVGIITGMIQSFYDAPGVQSNGKVNVFKEELEEVTYSLGLEYWYRKQFAIRGGYFHESQAKGNRKYFTLGVGLKMNVFGFDFSYLIPASSNNPLANTLRFSLSLDFDNVAKKNNGA
jgi:hypothetical protein